MNITILGSTGSIGKNTLDVISQHPDHFKVVALTAHQNVEELFAQCIRYQPKFAVMAQEKAGEELRERLKQTSLKIEVLTGEKALAEMACYSEAECVVAAIVGAAGLIPTLSAVRAGKKVLLANKEALVMSGDLFMQAVSDFQAVLLPVDSEHNAIFQCLSQDFRCGQKPEGVKHLWLTASGGPFRELPLNELSLMSPERACAHPNWKMGAKISVDSATMMNKALEVIEAYWLFHMELKQIKVVLHPQSIVHSLVEYQDGSFLAQLGSPDMRTPIAQALAWPKRLSSGGKSLDLYALSRLDFEPVSTERYPSLALGYETLHSGGTAAALLNAANEEAVSAFLSKKIVFTDIARISTEVLEKIPVEAARSIEGVLAADQEARRFARQLIC